jgi:anhydro-N-acetylmuramic acid kinase
MSARVYLGAISGTSVDGLDLALVEVGPSIRTIAARTIPLTSQLRQTLLMLGQPQNCDLDILGRTDAELGAFIGESALKFLRDHGREPVTITAIGSHGQTVRHRPSGNFPFTMQIGDPNRIAEITGITTVADFRRRDVAAGGQGAPLVPLFHAALFRHPTEHRAILNLGGIANLTVLPAGAERDILGFDTGPANALMDEWILLKRGAPFDASGAWSAAGRADQALLYQMLQDPYLAAPPPKSTGREYFNLPWLNRHLDEHRERGMSVTEADVQATLCAFTAESVAGALASWGGQTDRVIVCGGGRHNRTLLDGLATRIPCRVETSDEHGIDGDSIEAAAFAWLAHRTLDAQSGSAPSITGARGARVLGAVYHQ